MQKDCPLIEGGHRTPYRTLHRTPGTLVPLQRTPRYHPRVPRHRVSRISLEYWEYCSRRMRAPELWQMDLYHLSFPENFRKIKIIYCHFLFLFQTNKIGFFKQTDIKYQVILYVSTNFKPWKMISKCIKYHINLLESIFVY